MLAAVYSCRAITELMLEAADKQEIKYFQNLDPESIRKDLKSKFESELPYYLQLECIRIHDFHRFGIIPPVSNVKQTMFTGGPIKLKTQKEITALAITDQGLQKFSSKNAKTKSYRGLCLFKTMENSLMKDYPRS